MATDWEIEWRGETHKLTSTEEDPQQAAKTFVAGELIDGCQPVYEEGENLRIRKADWKQFLTIRITPRQ